MEAIHVAATPAELYSAVLVDTPLGRIIYFYLKIKKNPKNNNLNVSLIQIEIDLKWLINWLLLLSTKLYTVIEITSNIYCFESFEIIVERCQFEMTKHNNIITLKC